MRRVVMALIAGAVLIAVAQLRFGAGHPAVISIAGAGDAVILPSPSTVVPAGHDDRFGISGNVTGLYPGASLPLVLTIANPQQFAIVVTSITTSAGSPNAGCSSAHLTITPFNGSVSVPAAGTATVTVTATLNHSTPDACQGAVFPLTYAGTAEKP